MSFQVTPSLHCEYQLPGQRVAKTRGSEGYITNPVHPSPGEKKKHWVEKTFFFSLFIYSFIYIFLSFPSCTWGLCERLVSVGAHARRQQQPGAEVGSGRQLVQDARGQCGISLGSCHSLALCTQPRDRAGALRACLERIWMSFIPKRAGPLTARDRHGNQRDSLQKSLTSKAPARDPARKYPHAHGSPTIHIPPSSPPVCS